MQGVSWEIDIPLLSNRRMLGELTKVFAISWLVMGGLLGFIFAAQGEFDAILPVLGMGAVVCAGLFSLDGGEWTAMALAWAGLGYLTWMSYRALHGKWMAALLSDWSDLGE